MRIDEAIEMYKKIANTDSNCPRYCMNPCEECVKECKQLAEWLEELKAYRENSNGYNKEDIELNRNAMYNKAIDDFIRKCEMESRVILDEIIHLSYHGLSMRELQRIAEQLKAGVENE